MLIKRLAIPRSVTEDVNGRFFRSFIALRGIQSVRADLLRGFKQPLALAVSGGVDSIALSFLYATLLKNHDLNARAIGSRAYVVDHGAEANSAAEAQRTAEYLETKLDLPASVLTIDVPFGNHYETRARELRWRAIGQACLQDKQPRILAAHHFDDVIETFVSRLIKGHSGDSLLRPLPLTAFPIPKSDYGINEDFNRAVRGGNGTPSQMAGLGIQVLRPLLQVSKSELRQLCVDNGLEWIEDETNKDVRLTERNSIRHLLSKPSKLPKALQPAEIGWRITSMQARVKRIDELTDKLEEYLPKYTLDLRCGCVTQEFPISRGRKLEFPDKEDPLLTETDETVSMVIERYIERLGQTVNSSDSIGIRAEGTTALVEAIKKYLYHDLEPLDDQPIRERKYSARLVRWIVNKKLSSSVLYADLRVSCLSVGTHPTQPIVIPPGQSHAQKIMWDGLWWITIRNRSECPLELRTFGSKSYETFSQLLPARKITFETLSRVFKEQGMVYARDGLPVIAKYRPQDEGLELADPQRLKSIIAFPSLGWMDNDWFDKLDIEIQYKHVRESTRCKYINIPPMTQRESGMQQNIPTTKYQRNKTSRR